MVSHIVDIVFGIGLVAATFVVMAILTWLLNKPTLRKANGQPSAQPMLDKSPASPEPVKPETKPLTPVEAHAVAEVYRLLNRAVIDHRLEGWELYSGTGTGRLRYVLCYAHKGSSARFVIGYDDIGFYIYIGQYHGGHARMHICFGSSELILDIGGREFVHVHRHADTMVAVMIESKAEKEKAEKTKRLQDAITAMAAIR
jgi:hypothetical protein